MAKEAPTEAENPMWSLEDSRHSAIVYKPSSFANAAGPIITDPRSGEILESHINWYHNLMSILRESFNFLTAAVVESQGSLLSSIQSLTRILNGAMLFFMNCHIPAAPDLPMCEQR